MTLKENYKLFVDNKGDITSFEFDLKNSYYQFLKQKKDEGYTQYLITSDLMLSIIIDFLKDKKYTLISVKLYDTDDKETEEYIKKIFDDFSKNILSEEEIHKKLNYLESECSIDFTTITIKNCDLGKIILRSNGVFNVSDGSLKKILLNKIEEVWTKND